MLVQQDAVAALAFPEPQAAIEEGDWLWLNRESFHEWNTGTGRTFRNLTGDIHSKRKYKQGDALMLIMNNIDATNTMEIVGSVRSLLLLP